MAEKTLAELTSDFNAANGPLNPLGLAHYSADGSIHHTNVKQDTQNGKNYQQVVNAQTGEVESVDVFDADDQPPGENKVEESIYHEASSLSISVMKDGKIEIYSSSNGEQADPLISRMVYDPNQNTLTVSNEITIKPDGGSQTLPAEMLDKSDDPDYPSQTATHTYPVKMGVPDSAAHNAVIASDVEVPVLRAGTPESAAEKGVFTELKGRTGNLEATIYDRGRLSQGAVSIQYTNPADGSISLINVDENTFSIQKMNAEGGKSGAIVEMSEGIFAKNDFRYQPSADAQVSKPAAPALSPAN